MIHYRVDFGHSTYVRFSKELEVWYKVIAWSDVLQ